MITPRKMVGASIRRPGTWVAMSSSPTLLRIPDFWSVMRCVPLRSSSVRQHPNPGDHRHGAGAHAAMRRVDVVDHHQPVQRSRAT